MKLEAGLREQEVPIRRRIHRLWEEDHRLCSVDIAGVVVEAERQLDTPGADTEPVLPAIVEIQPVELRHVRAIRSQIASEQLESDAQLIVKPFCKIDSS